jgi:hypothetical protein
VGRAEKPVYAKKWQTAEEQNANMRRVIWNISQEERRRISPHVLTSCEVDRRHFEIVL